MTATVAMKACIIFFSFLGAYLTQHCVRSDDSKCRLMLVESIPVNMTYPPNSPHFASTYDAWMWLIGNATSHLNIASYYWTLLNKDITPNTEPTAMDGENTLSKLRNLVAKKIASVSVVTDYSAKYRNRDLSLLSSAGAQVRFLNVKRLLGAGILHTKLWTVDNRHAYIGSANMDWRSLTQVKELGVYLQNCSTLTTDLQKIVDTYALLSGSNSTIPSNWPKALHTKINMSSPFKLTLNGVPSQLYFAASPNAFRPPGRTLGITALTSVIKQARKFVYVSVMDYFPLVINYSANGKNTFWPVIDDAFRQAAIDRSVEVRILVSEWLHTEHRMWNYMRSLQAIHGESVNLQVKFFKVPGEKNTSIPFSRVNHSKYMVTDNTAYIGTSNWSGDYFLYTCGVGLIVREETNSSQSIRGHLQSIFERDWNSPFANDLSVE